MADILRLQLQDAEKTDHGFFQHPDRIRPMPNAATEFFTRSLPMRAFVVLLALLAGETMLIALLNREIPNNLLLPITQYLPMFSIIWTDNPWAAFQVLADKSLLAIGSFDERSGLYLWTIEFDAVSLLLHIIGAFIIARFIAQSRVTRAMALTGVGLLLLSHTYVTVMAHCAGPTWAGFVALYGLGVEKFPVNAMWQWAAAVSGSALLATLFLRRA